jgi:hypothetical protein
MAEDVIALVLLVIIAAWIVSLVQLCRELDTLL